MPPEAGSNRQLPKYVVMSMWIRRAAVAGCAIALALWVAAGVVLCENSLHVPRKPSNSRSQAGQRQNVEIVAADGVLLRGTFVHSPQGQDCVLLLHGISDSRQSMLGFAPMFLDAGY